MTATKIMNFPRELEHGVRFEILSVDDWISVPDCPRQRDTERHARRAWHLYIPSETHMLVHKGELPNGDVYKLDGHSRCLLWRKNLIPAPRSLICMVWPCATIADVYRLYTTFDNAVAGETRAEQLTGAIRQFQVTFQSPYLQAAQYAGVLRYLYNKMYGSAVNKDPEFLYISFSHYLPQLKLLDTCGPTTIRYPTGITMAALTCLCLYGHSATDFWNRYSKDLGTKLDGKRDAVQRLDELRNAHQLSKKGGGRSRPTYDLMEGAVAAFEADRNGQTFDEAVKEFTKKKVFDKYVVSARKRHDA